MEELMSLSHLAFFTKSIHQCSIRDQIRQHTPYVHDPVQVKCIIQSSFSTIATYQCIVCHNIRLKSFFLHLLQKFTQLTDIPIIAKNISQNIESIRIWVYANFAHFFIYFPTLADAIQFEQPTQKSITSNHTRNITSLQDPRKSLETSFNHPHFHICLN
uniref:Uncharacterized protein n=1 Tax=Rhizophora mucronata TaxID=61149 RepID=A0A2P2IL65_RHIMU